MLRHIQTVQRLDSFLILDILLRSFACGLLDLNLRFLQGRSGRNKGLWFTLESFPELDVVYLIELEGGWDALSE